MCTHPRAGPIIEHNHERLKELMLGLMRHLKLIRHPFYTTHSKEEYKEIVDALNRINSALELE